MSGVPVVRVKNRAGFSLMEGSSTQKYYLVSDLHMGGDGALQHCDYTAEFIAFLKQLEKEGSDTELLIVGDTFGFWELTLVQGIAKLDHIIAAHQAIFEQLRATGARVKVTMMVGNHDYELGCNANFAAKLQAYNIHLDKSLAVIRTVGDKKIWIEHGQQHDEFNAFPDYGNPHALPVGYFITESFVSGASRHSDFGRGNWLKDIRSVGTMQIPDWILSNYFYREMSAVLRWVLLPFLLLAGVTVVAIAGELLRVLGIFDYNILFHNPLMSRLGIIDNVLQVVITINSMFLVLFGVPALLLQRDLLRTLNRFRLLTGRGITPNLDSEESYLKAAQEVFQSGSQGDGVHLRTHACGVSQTAGIVWPSCPQHGNLAQAIASCSGALWPVARGLLSLISAQLLLHREREQPTRDHLCYGSQDA